MLRHGDMKVLVLGGAGMLGHKMFQILKERVPDTWCTVRKAEPAGVLGKVELLRDNHVICGVDASDACALHRLITDRCPEVIVNCIGVIKQRAEAKAAIPSIKINALLPHQLNEWCAGWNGRLIHFSTDCVFSGKRGSYSENDTPDAEDLYGRTKYLGEVGSGRAVTLRTSIIGRELTEFKSLLEWFLQQNHGKIMGYTRAYYSGVTTNYLAGLVARIIEEQPELSGLYQVTGATIPKYELLCLLRDAFAMDVEIRPDKGFFCDRSMLGTKFTQATGYLTPSWPDLIAELRDDPTPYKLWR